MCDAAWCVPCTWASLWWHCLIRDALRLCVSCAKFVTPFQLPHSRRWWSHLSTPDWTTAIVCLLVSQHTSYGDYSLFLNISDALVCLHWLRVPERVEYKIAMLTYKVLCGIAPRYLGPLNRVADVSGRHSLRSSGTNRLVVPPSDFLRSAAELFRLLPPRSGTHCRTVLFQWRHYRLSGAIWRHFCFSNLFPSTAVDLAVVLYY